MQRSLNNLQSHIPLVVFRSRAGGLLRIFFYALSTLCATCEAATYSSEERLPLRQLTEVWRDAFPLANVGMAPSTFPRTFPAGKPAPKAGVRLRSDRPHPAVARIVVPEQGATAYGSGTLIDVRDNFGLVITNWHVVRDATGTIEVVFPGGFTSKARALKVDADWDLAALVIWQPPIEPVSIAEKAPSPATNSRSVDMVRATIGALPDVAHNTTHPGWIFLDTWSSWMLKRGKATRAAPFSTKGASWRACCLGQGRGRRSAALAAESVRFLRRWLPTSEGQPNRLRRAELLARQTMWKVSPRGKPRPFGHG